MWRLHEAEVQEFNNMEIINNRNNANYYLKLLLAGKKIEIECIYKRGFIDCKDYLSDFIEPDFIVSASNEEIFERAVAIIGIKRLKDLASTSIELGDIESMIIYKKIAEKMLWYNIILMHGAAIAINNKCFIFIAPSGTGKTTHVLNWLKLFPDTIVVNGDKPLIDLDKKIVYGTPWSGKEKMNTNCSVPLSGIVRLERGLENSLTKVNFKHIFPALLQQCYIPDDVTLYHKAIGLIGKFHDIPCYNLICNMEVNSAQVAYDGLPIN